MTCEKLICIRFLKGESRTNILRFIGTNYAVLKIIEFINIFSDINLSYTCRYLYIWVLFELKIGPNRAALMPEAACQTPPGRRGPVSTNHQQAESVVDTVLRFKSKYRYWARHTFRFALVEYKCPKDLKIRQKSRKMSFNSNLVVPEKKNEPNTFADGPRYRYSQKHRDISIVLSPLRSPPRTSQHRRRPYHHFLSERPVVELSYPSPNT